MNTIRIPWLWLVAVISVIAACERTDVVDPRIVELYVDLRVASEEFGNNNEARIARQNLMRQAGIGQEQFAAEIQEIRANPELWMKFQNEVVARLDSLRNPDMKREKL